MRTPALLPYEEYKQDVKNSVQSSIDFLIHDGQRLLVGLRKNAPAKGFFFVPGGVVLKDEPITDAFKRISQRELSTTLYIGQSYFVGVLEEFFDENFSGDPTFGTHYISQCFAIKADLSSFSMTPGDEQHTTLIAMPYEDVMTRHDVHPFNQHHVDAIMQYKKMGPQVRDAREPVRRAFISSVREEREPDKWPLPDYILAM